MEAAGSYETPIPTYRNVQHHITYDINLDNAVKTSSLTYGFMGVYGNQCNAHRGFIEKLCKLPSLAAVSSPSIDPLLHIIAPGGHSVNMHTVKLKSFGKETLYNDDDGNDSSLEQRSPTSRTSRTTKLTILNPADH
jgi:hypothetical protein